MTKNKKYYITDNKKKDMNNKLNVLKKYCKGENMKNILSGGKLLDKKNNFLFDELDILIKDGKIAKIEKNIRDEEANIIDLKGKIISPGFIDIHVHCFPKNTAISSQPDDIGVKRGVTTIIDAGTAGAVTIETFYKEFIKKSKTRVYSNLNISNLGLRTLDELSEIKNIELKKIKEVLKKYGDVIVGLKARASGSVVKENGILPIKLGKEIAKEVNLPLVVHIGNAPPKVEDVLNLLGKGDVVTHCYNNKKNGLIRDGGVIPEVFSAKKRGVYFDIGHGSESFSLDIAKIALERNFEAETISTDLYERNMVTPVKSLEATINKMLYLGINLKDCIEKVTSKPAEVFKLNKLGELKVGYNGDLTIFNICDGSLELEDSVGKKVELKNYIKTEYVFIKDELIKV